MSDSKYYMWPSLEHIYLEDSYVLDIEESASRFRIVIDTVLTKGHAAYHSPLRTQQYCYKHGELIFDDIEKTNWLKKNPTPSFDLSGDIDFGNIYYLTRENSTYQVGGDWGDVKIHAPNVTFHLLPSAFEIQKPVFLGQKNVSISKYGGQPSQRLPHYRHRHS